MNDNTPDESEKPEPSVKNTPKKPTKPKKKRRWPKVLGVLLVLLIIGLVLLNGVGTRYATRHFLDKALAQQEVTGSYEVEGTLASGLSLKNVDLAGTAGIEKIKADELNVRYSLTGLIKERKLDDLSAKNVEVDLDVAKFPKSEKEKKPFDLDELRKTLETVRKSYAPSSVDLQNVTVNLEQNDKRLGEVYFEQFRHEPGSNFSRIKDLQLTGFANTDLPTQDVALLWTEERMTLTNILLPAGIQVSNLSVSAEPGTPLDATAKLYLFGGDIAVAVPDFETINAELTEGQVQLASLNALLNLPEVIGGRITTLKVALKNLRGDVNLQVKDLAYGSRQLEELRLLANLGEEKATLTADLSQQGDLARLSAELPIDGATKLDQLKGRPLSYELSVPNLAKVTEYAGTQLPSGQIFLKGTSEFLTANVVAETLTFKNGRFQGKPLPDLKGKASLQDNLAKAKLTATSGGDQLDLVANYHLKTQVYEVEKAKGSVPIRAYLPDLPLAGPLTVDIKGNGNVAERKHNLKGDVNGSIVTPNGPPIELDTHVEMVGPKITAKLTAQSNERILIGTAGYDLEQKSYQYDLKGEAPIEGYLPATVDLRQPLLVDVEGNGLLQNDVAKHVAKGEVKTTLGVNGDPVKIDTKIDIDWPRFVSLPQLSVVSPRGRIEGSARWEDDRLRVGGLQVADATGPLVVLDGSVPLPMTIKSAEDLLEVPGELDLSLSANEFSFSRYPALFPGIAGVIDGKIELAGTYARPKLNGGFTGENIVIEQLAGFRPLGFTLSLSTVNQTLELEGAVNEGGDGVAAIEGRFPLSVTEWLKDGKAISKEPLDATITVDDFSLRRLKPLVGDAFKVLEGTAKGKVELGGTVARPTYQGTVLLTSDRIQIANENVPVLRDVIVRVNFEGRKITLERSRLLGSGGEFNLEGGVNLEGDTPQIRLVLNAVRALVWRDDSISLRASGNLLLEGTLEQARLSGNLGFAESLFYKDFEFIPFGVPESTVPKVQLPSAPAGASSSTKVPVPEPYANWTLDVAISTPDPILVRGNLATGNVTGNGVIRGRLGEPQITLDAELNNASLELPLSKLEIESGTATLRPGLGFIPRISVRGSSRVGQFRVFVYAYGQATSPTLVFTSNPPLPEAEVLTLLATGTTTSGLEDQQVASVKAFQLLLNELRRKYAKEGEENFVTGIVGALDNLDLRVGDADPFSGRRFNSATLQLSSKFFVSASVDNEGNSRGIVIYALRF